MKFDLKLCVMGVFLGLGLLYGFTQAMMLSLPHEPEPLWHQGWYELGPDGKISSNYVNAIQPMTEEERRVQREALRPNPFW